MVYLIPSVTTDREWKWLFTSLYTHLQLDLTSWHDSTFIDKRSYLPTSCENSGYMCSNATVRTDLCGRACVDQLQNSMYTVLAGGRVGGCVDTIVLATWLLLFQIYCTAVQIGG